MLYYQFLDSPTDIGLWLPLKSIPYWVCTHLVEKGNRDQGALPVETRTIQTLRLTILRTVKQNDKVTRRSRGTTEIQTEMRIRRDPANPVSI